LGSATPAHLPPGRGPEEPGNAHLTLRENEIFRYVITGMLNKQIAYELKIAEKTVKIHRSRIMEKLCVDSVAELVRLAEKAGIEPTK